ncbi:RINT1-like protein MAG2 [Andrographis paniculata]|uniref:RINT1-like protein MAG2 n=1 Tax=Andrographis paniculata TaxID=175694 RepID=UPI0021E87238|nr:RINT1-like protein MAG2 [Andrographis paniculata]XP_051123173.1 RINT1-like protein MAG2 [Andrographis paniculata]
MTRALPPPATLSPYVISFLNSNLSSREDLDGAPNLLSELQMESGALDRTLSELNEELRHQLTQHSSHSNRVGSLLTNVHSQLDDLLRSSARSPPGDGLRRGMWEELQTLAKEVARVETVRNYAETALKLDTLVGDLEDAVSTVVNRTLRKQPSAKSLEDMRAVALRTLKSTEDLLSSVIKKHPQWAHLVSAVDHRIDRALAVLRPQAIADHRTLLISLGWPPPLSSLSSSNQDSKESTNVPNPLFTMKGDLKHQYCESFLALCGLQELQRRRKSRQLEGHYKDADLHQPLWVIEELVNPISIASQRHFSKWIDKPEFIFALVYKITRDYVDSMDDLLQPLVDEAMLSGYSCREEWISAMVSSLSTYLAKEIFPNYVDKLKEESDAVQEQAKTSWLHLVDLMIGFDKRVQSLAAHSGMLLSLPETGSMSLMTVFCDRPDWLDLWAEIELNDTLHKLKSHMEDDRNWINEGQQVSVMSGQEEYKSPSISSAVFRCFSSVIDRCRSVPNISLKSRFVRLAGAPIIHKFLDRLQQRCQEAEGLTALTDNSALTKVAKSINASHCFESVLKEYCEDVFFLEMEQHETTEAGATNKDSEARESGIFHEEIKKLEEFRNEWIEKLSTVVLRGFDALCRDYIKNKRQWQEKSDEASALSRSFVEAMAYLQGKLSILEEGLNKMDFTRVWRNVAAGIDKLVFNSIIMSNVKFHDGGVERLWNDAMVLFGIFGVWCLRPEGFFPKVNEALKLLKTEKKRLKKIGDERWLKENGIRNLSTGEVEKIAKNRVFTG